MKISFTPIRGSHSLPLLAFLLSAIAVAFTACNSDPKYTESDNLSWFVRQSPQSLNTQVDAKSTSSLDAAEKVAERNAFTERQLAASMLPSVEPLAKSGDRRAQYVLARLYAEGVGVPASQQGV